MGIWRTNVKYQLNEFSKTKDLEKSPVIKPSERLMVGMNEKERAQYQKAWEKTFACKMAIIGDAIRQIGSVCADEARKICRRMERFRKS